METWGEIILPLSQNKVRNELKFRSERKAAYFHAVCHGITVGPADKNRTVDLYCDSYHRPISYCH